MQRRNHGGLKSNDAACSCTAAKFRANVSGWCDHKPLFQVGLSILSGKIILLPTARVLQYWRQCTSIFTTFGDSIYQRRLLVKLLEIGMLVQKILKLPFKGKYESTSRCFKQRWGTDRHLPKLFLVTMYINVTIK